MSDKHTDRKFHSLTGALVADAAALGFHWLYDQARIRQVEPQTPEFHPINVEDYADVGGYFAHQARANGDLSQYGEQLWTAMQSINECDGEFSAAHYEQTFRSHFGYGGAYVGYIDRPTRDTLDKITREETALLAKANALDFSGTQQERNALMSKVRSYAQMLTGDALRDRLKSVIQQANGNPETIEYVYSLCDLIEQTGQRHGADDQQLPAVSKLPALAAVAGAAENYLDQVQAAVRVTNNNDTAVHYASALAILLNSLIDGQDISSAIDTCKASAHSTILNRFDQVDKAQGASIDEAVKSFGMACDLDYAFPSILFILKSSKSYADAIRSNIYAGGDSCGRAIIIGAAMGALHGDNKASGIPNDWPTRLSASESLMQLSQNLAASRSRT